MSVSRRKFLGGVAAGAGAIAASATAGAAGGPRHFEGYPGRMGLLHDSTLCVGCRSCEEACNEVNDNPPLEKPVGDMSVFEGHDLKHPRRVTDTLYTVVNRMREGKDGAPDVFLKSQCMHCNEPCCASVCFVKAFKKTPEGPVLYDPDLCVGCRYCVNACPYHALSYEYDKPFEPRVVRCTMCYDRITKGQQPGCAEACPMGAIVYGEREDLLQMARERIRKHPERYVDHIYGEHEFAGTSWLMLAGFDIPAPFAHRGVTHTPIPELGSTYLSVVPLILSIYPGLLLGFYAFSKRKDRLAQQALDEAVAEAVANADAETKEKLASAAARAKKDKEKAVAAAVKKALKEAEKKAREEAEQKAREEAGQKTAGEAKAKADADDKEDSK